ncbi:hypothetical protein Pfo_029249 [Paulownia fortunei]|nr:hypothetical protein Pfo_029249 [Paulownia fortunei]
MARSGMIKATCLVLIAAVVVAPLLTEAAAPPKISCGKVTSTLAPCFEYVLSGGKVPINCCAGVKSLYKEASTTADRRNVCLCLKSVTSSASPAAIKNAKASLENVASPFPTKSPLQLIAAR